MSKLYRPAGLKELYLLLDSGCRAWPPRLPSQPIFYPVCNERYAIEIAKNWNTKYDAEAVGFVTEMQVAEDVTARYERHVVGAAWCEELWVPAQELPVFNRGMTEPVKIIHGFYGKGYRGGTAGGKWVFSDYASHLASLWDAWKGKSEKFPAMVAENWKEITASYLLWTERDFPSGPTGQEKDRLLLAVREELERHGKWFLWTGGGNGCA